MRKEMNSESGSSMKQLLLVLLMLAAVLLSAPDAVWGMGLDTERSETAGEEVFQAKATVLLDQLHIDYTIVEKEELPRYVTFVKVANYNMTGIVTTFEDLETVLAVPEVDSAYILNDITMDYELTIDKDFTFIGLRGDQMITSNNSERHFTISGGDVVLDLRNITLNGMYMSGGLDVQSAFFEVRNGAIVNCRAPGNGGAIETSDLATLVVRETAFHDNSAGNGGWYISDAEDIALHVTNIDALSVSSPFTEYAYNNYDISYEKGTSLESGIKVVRNYNEIITGLAAGCNELWIANDIQFDDLIFISEDLKLVAYEQESVTLLNAVDFEHFYVDGAQVHLEMDGVVLRGNADLYNPSHGAVSYGGIAVQCGSGSFQLTGGIIENCISGPEGGGIAVFSSGSTEIRDCIIRDNHSLSDGGGILIHRGVTGEVNIIDCGIINNVTEGGGGGIYNASTSARLDIIDCIIADNTATNGGGVGATSCGRVFVDNCDIFDNSANMDGAGIFGQGAVSVTISNSRIRGNQAGNSGAGIRLINTMLNISDTTISDNVAASGGGIYVDYLDNINWGARVYFSKNLPEDIYFEQ